MLRNAHREAIRVRPPKGAIPNPDGRCLCGCGEKTKICTSTRRRFGQYFGYPQRFIHGHDSRGQRSRGWKGGRKIVNGYVLLYRPRHRLADCSGYVFEHRLVAERKLRRHLKPHEIVHHKNGKKADNDPSNLQVMTRAAHVSLHNASARDH